jgi:hypothetical protein
MLESAGKTPMQALTIAQCPGIKTVHSRERSTENVEKHAAGVGAIDHQAERPSSTQFGYFWADTRQGPRNYVRRVFLQFVGYIKEMSGLGTAGRVNDN